MNDDVRRLSWDCLLWEAAIIMLFCCSSPVVWQCLMFASRQYQRKVSGDGRGVAEWVFSFPIPSFCFIYEWHMLHLVCHVLLTEQRKWVNYPFVNPNFISIYHLSVLGTERSGAALLALGLTKKWFHKYLLGKKMLLMKLRSHPL